MRNVYHRAVALVLTSMLLLKTTHSDAQCPDGLPPGSVAYDTTIATPAGITSMQVKFPQFDPVNGMVKCVRLCVSITGVVDSVSVENNSASSQTADIYYIRTDQITGPGLAVPLVNSINYHYGPYTLGPTTAPLGGGPDFIAISHDTLLNAVTVCRTLSDSASIVAFYGTDSVSYTYDITAFTNISCTGGNYNSSVATSAFVRFRFEYCTCNPYLLPINNYNFTAVRESGQQVKLDWSNFDRTDNGNYYYEAQVSRDGAHFETFAVLPKSGGPGANYHSIFTAQEMGIYFFRIKQLDNRGKSYFTVVRHVDIFNGNPVHFTVYPNPSDGIVGIKFDINSSGKFIVLINNELGQTVVNKEVTVSGGVYQQVATLNKGFYWVRVVDPLTRQSFVNQLFIK